MSTDTIVTIIQSAGPLLGVLIGSLIAALTTMLTNRHAANREERIWEKEQEAKTRDDVRQSEREKREMLVKTYHDALTSLFSLAALDEKLKLQDNQDERNRLLREAVDHVSLLLVIKPDLEPQVRVNLDLHVSYLISHPSCAKELAEVVKSIALSDRTISSDHAPQTSKKKETLQVRLKLSNDFRRSQYIAGSELPMETTFECELADLSPDQREKICELYFRETKVFQKEIQLHVPKIASNGEKIVARGPLWEAQINPATASVKEVFDAWERDFDSKLAEVQAAFSKQSSSES